MPAERCLNSFNAQAQHHTVLVNHMWSLLVCCDADLCYHNNSYGSRGEKNKEIAKVKDEYRDKVEEQLETRAKETKEMYNEILKRLPDVNVKLRGEVIHPRTHEPATARIPGEQLLSDDVTDGRKVLAD